MGGCSVEGRRQSGGRYLRPTAGGLLGHHEPAFTTPGRQVFPCCRSCCCIHSIAYHYCAHPPVIVHTFYSYPSIRTLHPSGLHAYSNPAQVADWQGKRYPLPLTPPTCHPISIPVDLFFRPLFSLSWLSSLWPAIALAARLGGSIPLQHLTCTLSPSLFPNAASPRSPRQDES